MYPSLLPEAQVNNGNNGGVPPNEGLSEGSPPTTKIYEYNDNSVTPTELQQIFDKKLNEEKKEI